MSRERLDGVTDLSGRMSPFSEQSEPARAAAIARWRDVVDGASDDVPAHLRDQLPDLLWLFHMGIILFWVHDRSSDQIASRLAIGAVAPIIVRAIALADVPELHAPIDDLIRLVGTLRDASA